MKNKGFKILSIAAGAVIVGLSVWVFMLKHETPAPVDKPSAIIDEAKTEAKIIAQKVDQKGYAVTTLERKADIIGKGDISKLPVSQSVIDSLRLDNLAKDAKLQQASAINATLQISNARATKLLDSLNHVKYVYRDKFANVSFTPDSLSGKFDLSYNIKLIRHDYTRRKSIFSPRVNYTDILSPDTNITINGL